MVPRETQQLDWICSLAGGESVIPAVRMVAAKAQEGVADGFKQQVGLKVARFSVEAQFGSRDAYGSSQLRMPFHVKHVAAGPMVQGGELVVLGRPSSWC